jgi:hypothetical protein
MIHLAAAVQLGLHDECFVSPDFLLGSIAPDSIHMRPGSSRDDKELVHLVPLGERFAPDEAIHDLVLSYQDQGAALAHFALGYAAHILTDMLWMRQVVDTFNARIPPQILADRQQHRDLYYGETDQVDFNLYHQASWRPEIWRKLAEAAAPDFPPWLSSSEIDQWRSRTLRWFTDLKAEPGISPQYITDALAADFVGAAVADVKRNFAIWGIITHR